MDQTFRIVPGSSIPGTLLPIGAIVRQFEGYLDDAIRSEPYSERQQVIDGIFHEFDERFESRPDYKLWRSTLCLQSWRKWQHLGPRETALSANWRRLGWGTFARQGAESANDVTLWSTVAVFADLMGPTYLPGREAPSPPIWNVVCRLYGRLLYDMQPLELCPASSGVAAAIFVVQYHTLRHRCGLSSAPSDIQGCVDQLVRWLACMDPAWKPGRKLQTDHLIRERKGPGRLRPNSNIYEFDKLTESLSSVARLIERSMPILDSISYELRRKACEFAYTAWRTARSRRLWETEHQLRVGRFGAEKAKRRVAFLREFECVRRLSTALRDAEFYLEAAKVMYLALRLIPNEFASDAHVRTLLRRRWVYFSHMMEAGLEVDSRFFAEEEFARRQALREISPERLEGKDAEEQAWDVVPHNTMGFHLIIERDQKIFVAWKVLLDQLPRGNDERLKPYLRRSMNLLTDASHSASAELLRAGFFIARRYGYIRSAGKILARSISAREFEITKKDLIDFVHSVRRCMSLDPFGMHHATASEWKELILEAFFLLYRDGSGPGWFTPRQKLWIHETLIGRTHTHHRSLSYDGAERLYRKAAGTYDIDDLREFYDREYNFYSKPFGVATAETIAQYCRDRESSPLRAPVFVTVMRAKDVLSIACVSKSGSIGSAEINAVGLDDDLEDVAGLAEFWFKTAAVPFAEHIPWPRRLRKLGHAILGMVREFDPGARVIMLSVEPELAHLPWQHLIGSCVTESCGSSSPDIVAATQYLVSVIPNASTVTIPSADEDGYENGLQVLVSDERDQAIQLVADMIERTVNTIDHSQISVRILLGHGRRRSGSSLPAIRLGEGRELHTIEEWIKIARSRHIILHCCHSGLTDPIFMRELGGLPGVALSLGARALLAPVSEVSANAAAALQECMFSWLKPATMGEKYLGAIRREPAVCLYNFFGDPYEVLTIRHICEPEYSAAA